MNQSYLEAIDLIWSAKGVAALMRATDAAAEHDGLFGVLERIGERFTAVFNKASDDTRASLSREHGEAIRYLVARDKSEPLDALLDVV